jgi:hypothetical protein
MQLQRVCEEQNWILCTFFSPCIYLNVKLHKTSLRIKVPLLLSIKLVLPTHVQFMHDRITIFVINITNYWNTTRNHTYNIMMILNSCCRIAAAPKVATWCTPGLNTRHKWKKLSGLRSNWFSFKATFTNLYCVRLFSHSHIKLYSLQKFSSN